LWLSNGFELSNSGVLFRPVRVLQQGVLRTQRCRSGPTLIVPVLQPGAVLQHGSLIPVKEEHDRDKNFLPFRAAQSERLGPDPGG